MKEDMSFSKKESFKGKYPRDFLGYAGKKKEI